jgi:conjugative relaxase-like TrwC/TraI family protein
MLRVTTLYASSAIATASYYALYLAGSPGEEPGVWCGDQAIGLGLSGGVAADDLRILLEGRDPTTGTPLGNLLVDRTLVNGRVVRAVAGFDATFSAPKSVSVWWALTGDPGLLEAHDVAVRAVLEHLERYGATTRVRVNGGRQHPDTLGLTVATFRQTTSRADDPQLHTHAVISARVRTVDGRWWALDARYLKRNQRMLGGLYQSVLRAELTHRYGIGWEPIVHGQAEIAGMPAELLEVFSKRARQVDAALAVKVDEFRVRQGRDPSRWERAALTREASADTRARKTGNRVSDLATRWQGEAAGLGWTPRQLVAAIDAAGRDLAQRTVPMVTVEQVIDQLSASGSTWTRADILRGICDLQPAVAPVTGQRWAAALERACDQVIDHCVDLDPAAARVRRRASDGRSIWLEPIAPHFTSDRILAEEERVLAWAMDAQADGPEPSTTIDRAGLDVLQADAAAAVAGSDRLVLVVGPAGTGKTTALERAVDDLAAWNRPVFGVAPTAKAARVLQRETGMAADTVAKLFQEWSRADRPPLDHYRLPIGTTLIVDEAGMLGTASLHQLVGLAEAYGWRLALVGDPHQLQAVGRGGLFNELCATSRAHELSRIHRFHERWEAAASLQLRTGDPGALDAYEAHDRIAAGTFLDHVELIARGWVGYTLAGKTVAITAATNDHVDALNDAVQRIRITIGQLRPDVAVTIAGGELAYAGDIVTTRRNDRELRTSSGEPVRNRDLWNVVATHSDGALTVSHRSGHGTTSLPPDYVNQHVRLGYAATEHGLQGDTVDVGIAVVSAATTHRGLYVAMTRGRGDNRVHVITETTDRVEARDVLECVLAHNRADIPAVTQRRDLARQMPPHDPTPVRRSEPTSVIPAWVAPWRTQLEHQREDLAGYLAQRAERRAEAATELVDLQPALTAARTAWQPYAERIAAIEDELRTELRPAMWKANHDATHASFGHRHRAARQTKDTTERVDTAEAHIAAIRADGSDVKQRLDALDAEARNLHDLAHPSSSGYALEAFNGDQLDQTVGLLDAVDIWTTWAYGRPISTDELAAAVATLSDVARRAPLLALNASEIDRSQWFDALQPVTELLRVHGINLPSDRHLELEPNGPELGIGL